MESIKSKIQQYAKNNKQKLKDTLYIAIYTILIISILTTIAYVIQQKQIYIVMNLNLDGIQFYHMMIFYTQEIHIQIIFHMKIQ